MPGRVELSTARHGRSRVGAPLSVESSADSGKGTGRGLLSTMWAVGALLLRVPRWLAWLPPMLWAALIWFGSGMRDVLGPGYSSFVAYLANMAHAFEFGILTLLLLPCAPRAGGWVQLDKAVLAFLAFLALSYAAVDEMHQAFVPGRQSSPLDWLTDAVGVYCTLKVALYISQGGASERGLIARCVYGVFLCALATGFSTLAP